MSRSLQEKFAGRVIGIPCDITIEDAVRAAADRIEREFGPIDILHNNAATKGTDLAAFLEPTESYGLDTWRKAMAVNINAMFLVRREIGGRMAKRRRGSIIEMLLYLRRRRPDPRI